MSIDSIIALLGGTSIVAQALGVSSSVVSNWRKRGRIPVDRWEALVCVARSRAVKGITLEALAGIHATREPVEA